MVNADSNPPSEHSASAGRAAGARGGDVGAAERRPGGAWLAALVLLLAGYLAFENGFEGVFVFDDEEAILTNPHVQALPSVIEAMGAPRMTTLETRPLPSLSLALNYSLGEFEPRGYHVFNLGVHLLATLLLFGLVRRVLRLESLRERFGRRADGLAFAVALLWSLHPLQTESVTYTVQRVESMMGLAYLATLYFSLRYFTTRRRGFFAAAWLACLAGMASKEVMVTAPVVVYLLDALLVDRRWSVLKRRAPFYGALAATWALLVWLVFATGARQDSVGFDMEWVAGRDYLLNQFAAWGLYLRLAIWPHPQVFDYGWPVPIDSWTRVLPGVALLGALVSGTLWALVKRPGLGFLGAAFLLILSPTTSVVPIITEVYAEHRMYLPLAAVVAFVVLAAHATLGRLLVSKLGATGAAGVGWSALVVAAGLLAWRTHVRNELYYSKEALWRDTVARRPENDRAHNQYGLALVLANKRAEAREQFAEAVRLRPEYYYWRQSLATCLYELGRLDECEAELARVLELKADFPLANLLQGFLLFRRGQHPQAEPYLLRVLEVEPTNASAGQYLTQILEGYRRAGRTADLQRLEREQARLQALWQGRSPPR